MVAWFYNLYFQKPDKWGGAATGAASFDGSVKENVTTEAFVFQWEEAELNTSNEARVADGAFGLRWRTDDNGPIHRICRTEMAIFCV